MTSNLAEEAIRNLHIDKNDAISFFILYARYEFAAKACGLVHRVQAGGDLKVNPQEVGKLIGPGLTKMIESDPNLSEAVNYFQKSPPLKQIWNGSRPEWTQVQHSGSEAKCLLLALGQLRNNLFHGGKGWMPDADSTRESLLLKYGLRILEAVVNSNDPLRNAFRSYL